MPSVFTSIIQGELPAHCLWKDHLCVSFLSINPLTDGHALIVPLEETDHWLDLPTGTNMHLMHIASLVGNAQMEVYEPSRIGQVIAGFEVPHTHLHVLPIQSMNDLDFSQAAKVVDHNHLREAASTLRRVLSSHGHSHVVESFT